MSGMKMGETFDPRALYHVFTKREPGGGRVVILVEAEVEGYTDYVYDHTSESRARNVIAYEISSPGIMNSNWVHRALLARYGYVGEISGYGANKYFREGGNLKQTVKEFGTLAKKPGVIRRIMNLLRGYQRK
jgi:hypothetical protein